MKMLNLFLGILSLLAAAGLVYANLTLPPEKIWFDIGYGNWPWAHPYRIYAKLPEIDLPPGTGDVPLTLAQNSVNATLDNNGFLNAYGPVRLYGAVTNAKGEFAIKDIPAGTYTVEAWHEALGKAKLANVKVESGKAVKVKLEFKK